MRQSNPQEHPTINQAQSDASTDDFLQKAVSELSVADILNNNAVSTKKIEEKLNNIREDFKTQVSSLDKRIKFLKAEKKNEDNTVLKNTITNLQKLLSSIDAKERAKNLINASLLKEIIKIGEENVTNDIAKVKFIFKSIEMDENLINDARMISRI